MSIFHDVLRAASGPAAEAPGDYRDQNGILHCGVCGKPKEMPSPPEMADFMPVLTVQCQCQIDALERDERERKRAQRRVLADESMRILEEMGAMVFPAETFSMDDGGDTAIGKKVMAYANSFDRAFAADLGLLLAGPVGSGKTFWAACVANRLISDGRMVIFSDLRRLVNAVNDKSGENRRYILRCVRGCDLLILDDLGAERDSAFMAEQVFQIVNERYIVKKPMLVTSNIEPAAMAKAAAPGEARIYQRILERCKVIPVQAARRRAANAARNDAVWRSILSEESL